MSLLALACCLSACNGQRKATDAGATTTTTQGGAAAPVTAVSLSQGACFGTCPVFTFAVAADGSADYTGKRYAPYPGLHHGTVEADTLAKVMALAQAVLAKADQLPREIETGIVDYSETTIAIMTAADTLTFTGTTEFAAGVTELNALLRRVVDQTAFTRDPDAEPLPPSRLRLVLRSADQIQVVQEGYFRQKFRVVRLLSEDPATFLVSFDPFAMSAEEMIASLMRNDMVVSAEVFEEGD